MSHPLRIPLARRHADAPPWPSYTGTSQLVGTSPSGAVTVYVDPSLGNPALQNAQDLLNDADRVVAANNAIFGTPGGPVNVIVFALGGATDGTGGADHGGCDYISGNAIEVCASFGRPGRVSALFEAELSECSMGGNLCGVSTGEALSRWCALVTSNNALPDFATAPQWAQDGMPDFVNQTDPTDRNADSTGCGMAFISWLLSKGPSLNQIAQQMVALGSNGTFADLYAKLTKDAPTNAWSAFLAAVQALPNGVTSDDPFGAAPQQNQSTTTISIGTDHRDAVEFKKARAQVQQQAGPGATWHTVIEPTPAAAANFLNTAPAQGAGEAFVSNRADGQVDVYYFL